MSSLDLGSTIFRARGIIILAFKYSWVKIQSWIAKLILPIVATVFYQLAYFLPSLYAMNSVE